VSEFFILHRDLPREGPGEPGDIAWALDEGGLGGAARVVDAGCGPGADLVTLAEALPEARIEGIEAQAHFVEAARQRVAQFGERVTVRRGDMCDIAGPVDFIWCAGALYFLGVTEGLAAWRPALAPGGAVCFTEPAWCSDTPSDVARVFWEEYPAIAGMDGIKARVEAAGYRVLAARFLEPSAWAAYYVPQSARIAALRPGASPDLAKVLDAAEAEIAGWRAAPEEITYAQLLVAPR
jgi:trans-aconitate methyltransferase